MFFSFRVKKTDIIDLSWGTSHIFSKISWANEIPEPNGNGGTEHGAKVRSIQLLWRFWSSSERQGVERPRRSPSIWQRLGVSGLWRHFCVMWRENCQVKEMFAQQYCKCFHWLASFCLGRVSRNLRFQNPAGLKQNLAMKSWNNWHHDTFSMGLDEAGYTSRGVIGCTQPRRVAVLLA